MASSSPPVYLITNCAACAAPLAHNAPRCVRCFTRYCDSTCQQDHWRRGHKQICKKIHRGGNAEQYYADKKYKEAVAVAVKACADDMKLSTRVNGKDHGETQYYLDNLATVREEQLDWCIHDLTPATFEAYRDS